MITGFRCGWLVAAATVLGCIRPCIGEATVSPGVFEVDLVFPRNETFAPGFLPPVVFAVQNPALAYSLGASIDFIVHPYGKVADNPRANTGGFQLYNLNSSTASPHFAAGYMSTVAYEEDTWVFGWTLSIGNCPNATFAQYVNYHNHIIFTTSNRAPAPDLVAATSRSACSSTEGVAYNVTGFFQDVYNGPDPVCAEIGEGPSPEPSPCAVTINASTAAAIAAANSENACDILLIEHNDTSICSRYMPSPGATSHGLFHAIPGIGLLAGTAILAGLIRAAL